MSLLREIGLFFVRKMRETLRQPVWMIVGLSTPLLYLALFAPLLTSYSGGPGFRSGNILDVFVPGILALMAFSSGMGAGWIMIWELSSGVVERLRVTPASRFSLLMGTVLHDVIMLWVPALLVVLIAIPFRFPAALGRHGAPVRAHGPAHGECVGLVQRAGHLAARYR